MYQYHDFHESYHRHTCLVVPERDVLDTDIVGSGCLTRLKRWWHDLFLLSYTCPRTRGFYTSSHAMTIERFRQHRKYRHRIHPMSKFRMFWDTLIMCVILAKKVMFRFTSSIFFGSIPLFFYYLGAFLEVIIVADLFVNLKTGYIDVEAKRVVLDSRKSLLKFCSHKLFLHFVAAIPLHWFLFLRYGTDVSCGLCKTNRFTCALRIIGVFGLYRVYETTDNFNKNHGSDHLHVYKFIRILVVGFVSMLQLFELSESFFLLFSIASGQVPKNSRGGVWLLVLYGMSPYEPIPAWYNFIFSDLFGICKCLLLFPLSHRAQFYSLDKLVSLLAYLMAHGFYLWCILECFSLISRIMYPKERLNCLRGRAYNLIACRQLPDELRYKIGQYYKFRPTHKSIIENSNILYKSLPTVLKTEAKVTCYMSVMRLIPFFSNLPMSALEEIVLMLKKEVFLSNDIVTEAWAPARGLMIVDNGLLAVFSHLHEETGHLIDGDYFGELSLVTDKEICMSYVVAITPCTILTLPKSNFRGYMRDFPELFDDVKNQLKERLNQPVSLSTRPSIDKNHDEETKV